jgi:hypothetical protein
MSSTARSLRNEADHLPQTITDLANLRVAVMNQGHSARTADGIVAWVLAKTAGHPDSTSQPTRAKYRKILADLAGQPHNLPGSGKPFGGEALTAHNHRSAAVMSGVAGVAARALRLTDETAAERVARLSARNRKSAQTRARLRVLRSAD